jgi:hypothetical protein
MNTTIVEIVGFKDSECCPFPCDENRTCGLTACLPSNLLLPATEALRAKLREEFPEGVTVTLTLLDDGVPDYILNIYESMHPAIPMILINKELLPLGRISYKPISEAIKKLRSA